MEFVGGQEVKKMRNNFGRLHNILQQKRKHRRRNCQARGGKGEWKWDVHSPPTATSKGEEIAGSGSGIFRPHVPLHPRK